MLRDEWAKGLRTVLKISIPFEEFQDYLGLPRLGIHGDKKGDVDFIAFLHRFVPTSKFIKKDQSGEVVESDKPLMMLIHLLHSKRYELESLFRYFDFNGDGAISIEEFKEGLGALEDLVDHTFTETEVNRLVEIMDTDGDGDISYAEFFNSFRMSDPKLAEQQEIAAQRAAERSKYK